MNDLNQDQANPTQSSQQQQPVGFCQNCGPPP